MIYSMTGLTNKSLQLSNFSIQIDIKSVNHRFFELNIKSPEEFKNIEQQIRDLVIQKVSRGKLDIRINIKESQNSTPKLNFNQDVFNQYDNLAKTIMKQIPQAKPLSVADIFNLPRVLSQDTYHVDELQTLLLNEIPNLLLEFTTSQIREGDKLSLIINKKLIIIKNLFAIAKKKLPELIYGYQFKLRTKLQEVLDDSLLSEQRLQQEFAYFCQKVDVTEEIDRLDIHVNEFMTLLKQGGTIGKKLDFISQEMHREANTFGAKSVALETTKLSIELKVIIEQIREQVQNIM